MKTLLIATLIASTGIVNAQDFPVIRARDARAHVGERVTIEYESHTTGENADGYTEVYSTPEWHHWNSFILRFSPEAQEKAKRLGIDSISNHYVRRHLRVTGIIEWTHYDRSGMHFPCISVSDLSTIEFVAPKEYSLRKSEFIETEIEGFTVYFSSAIDSEEPGAIDLASLKLQKALRSINGALPEYPIGVARLAPIVCFHNTSEAHRMTYHPHKDFIASHGMPLFMHRAIEIHRVRMLLADPDEELTATLCHEFAHVFHNLALTDLNSKILEIYNTARDSGLYEPYDLPEGGKSDRYARTNESEYFAELSRCYFFHLRYPPHNRKELLAHDPKGFSLIETAWFSDVGIHEGDQGGGGQPATRAETGAEGSDKPHSESERRSR